MPRTSHHSSSFKAACNTAPDGNVFFDHLGCDARSPNNANAGIQGHWPAGAEAGGRQRLLGGLTLLVVPAGARAEEEAEAYSEDQTTIETVFSLWVPLFHRLLGYDLERAYCRSCVVSHRSG